MNQSRILQDEKAELDAQIAALISQSEAKKEALELAIVKARNAELAQGTLEIQAVLKKFQMSMEDMGTTVTASASKGKAMASGNGSRLAELREYYKRHAA